MRRTLINALASGTALVLCWLTFGAETAPTDQDASSASESRHEVHKVVCKDEPLPKEGVILGQLRSPRCGEARGASTYNAWEVGPAKAGVAACKTPDYMNADGQVIRFIGCGAIVNDACPGRVDGGPNAFMLKRPAQCEDERTQTQCEHTQDPFDVNSVIVAEEKASVCGSTDPTLSPDLSVSTPPYNRTKRRVIRPGDFVPVCAAFLSESLIDRYARQTDSPILVVRNFFDFDCPDRIRDGVKVVNAYVVTMIDTSTKLERQLICSNSALSIDPAVTLTHDDRCGTGDDSNGAFLTIH